MKHVSRILMILCVPFLLCTPAMAQHSGPYVGAFLGGSALTDAKSSDDQGLFALKFTPAVFGSAVVGWDLVPGSRLGEGRIELEYSRRSNPLDKVKFVEGNFKGGGHVTADSLLVNFVGVVRDGSRWTPYAGAGVGAARIKADDLTVIDQPMSSDSAVVFAYQGLAGLDVALTNWLNLDLGYRFFGTISPKLTEANGRTFKMDYLSHNVVLGLRVGF